METFRFTNEPHDRDVSDFTKPKLLFWNVAATIVCTIDALAMAFTSLTVCALTLFLSPLACLGHAAHDLKHKVAKALRLDIKDSSAVNSLDTSFLEEQLPLPKATAIDRKFNSPQPLTGEPHECKDIMLLLLRVCASAYEKQALCKEYLRNLTLTRRATRLVYENCSCVVLGWGSVIIVAFKGTSPYNLNEWLCDFSIKKAGRTPKTRFLGCDIAGQVHDGFYHALFPPCDRTYMETPFAEIVDKVYEFMQESNTPVEDLKLWITGHSLGAAVATMFVTVLATAKKAAEAFANPERSADGPAGKGACFQTSALREAARRVAILRKGLKGVVTFGNPRVADKELAERVDAFLDPRKADGDRERKDSHPDRHVVRFLRVRNGNDIVSMVPLDFRIIPAIARKLRDLGADGTINEVALNFDYDFVGEGVRFDHLGNDLRNVEPDRPCVDHVPWLATGIAYYALNAVQSVATAVTTPFIPAKLFPAESLVHRDTFGTAALKLLSGFTFGLSTFITDHIPGEYFKHIKAAH